MEVQPPLFCHKSQSICLASSLILRCGVGSSGASKELTRKRVSENIQLVTCPMELSAPRHSPPFLVLFAAFRYQVSPGEMSHFSTVTRPLHSGRNFSCSDRLLVFFSPLPISCLVILLMLPSATELSRSLRTIGSRSFPEYPYVPLTSLEYGVTVSGLFPLPKNKEARRATRRGVTFVFMKNQRSHCFGLIRVKINPCPDW